MDADQSHLASGPVVAGVIGQRRILFDLWGNTVNIHLAASTLDLLPEIWSFDERESVDAKGVGPMTTHLLASDEANSSHCRSCTTLSGAELRT
jgi:hypothetical protein